jgi:Protein of unknown function (DUF3096)
MMQANSAARVSQGWQCIASRIVPKSAPSHAGQFWAFFASAGTLLSLKRLLFRTASCSGPSMIFFGKPVPTFPDHALGCASRIEILPPIARAERFSMTLTVAHISPIISLVAGVLILIMPRLLNLIVAIFLILNGLIGLGLLKWLHL